MPDWEGRLKDVRVCQQRQFDCYTKPTYTGSHTDACDNNNKITSKSKLHSDTFWRFLCIIIWNFIGCSDFQGTLWKSLVSEEPFFHLLSKLNIWSGHTLLQKVDHLNFNVKFNGPFQSFSKYYFSLVGNFCIVTVLNIDSYSYSYSLLISALMEGEIKLTRLSTFAVWQQVKLPVVNNFVWCGLRLQSHVTWTFI